MERHLTFLHNDQEFNMSIVLENTSPLIIDNTLKLCFDKFKKSSKPYISFLNDTVQNDIIIDEDNNCKYRLISKDFCNNNTSIINYLTEIIYVIKVEPICDSVFSSITYNINNYGGEVNFDNSITNINNQLSLLPLEDQESAKELFEYIIQSEQVEKSKLEKFKDMLLRNTDVLGLLSQILLAIISKPV